jgi:hypothetical protein
LIEWAFFLAAAAAPVGEANIREAGVMIPASGGCYGEVIKFAREHDFSVGEPYRLIPPPPAGPTIECVVGPCQAENLYLWSKKRTESVERAIETYLTRGAEHASCFERRQIYAEWPHVAP